MNSVSLFSHISLMFKLLIAHEWKEFLTFKTIWFKLYNLTYSRVARDYISFTTGRISRVAWTLIDGVVLIECLMSFVTQFWALWIIFLLDSDFDHPSFTGKRWKLIWFYIVRYDDRSASSKDHYENGNVMKRLKTLDFEFFINSEFKSAE